ncbi:MAG: cadherin-like domain-containing protein [Burkholderiaceae bacterium]
MLRIDDVDSPAVNRLYTVTTAPTIGALRLNSTAPSVGQTFTQADVDGGLISYLHNDAELFTDSFQFTYQE